MTIPQVVRGFGLRISFDRVADRYDETRAYAEGTPRRIAQVLEAELTLDCTILEVGVGTGRTAEPLRDHGFDIVGVDVSRQMLHRAMAKGIRDILLADVTALPFKDGAFDHVLCVHVTHLVRDWRTAVHEMVRVVTGKIVAMATERGDCAAEAMRLAYEEFCAQAGYEIRHPGITETDLAEEVPPDKRVVVAESSYELSVADMIERFRERVYADLWGVPQGLHHNAVQMLEDRYAGMERISRRERVVLMLWEARKIGERVAGEP